MEGGLEPERKGPPAVLPAVAPAAAKRERKMTALVCTSCSGAVHVVLVQAVLSVAQESMSESDGSELEPLESEWDDGKVRCSRSMICSRLICLLTGDKAQRGFRRARGRRNSVLQVAP